MNLRNSVTLIGHLGRNADTFTLKNGQPGLRFSLATNRYYQNQEGERVEQTDWHECVLWGKRSEKLAPYLEKGKQVVVNGSLQHRKWTNQEGKEQQRSEVIVSELTFVGSRA